MANLQELLAIPQLQLLVQRQLREQGLESGRRESRYIAQLSLAHRLQVDPAAHASIKDEGRLRDPKAAPQGMQKPLQSLGVITIASED